MPSPGGRYRRYLSLREGWENAPRVGANNKEIGPMNWTHLVPMVQEIYSARPGQ